MTISMRAPTSTDREQWAALYHGYADFYQVPMNETILNTVWGWIFDDSEAFYCRVAENESDDLVGLMHFRAMSSPIRGAKVGFLDDLFIAPECRGGGVVELMFNALEAAAKDNNWPFVRWITAADNYRGRRVYDKLAAPTQWRTYQLDTTA